MWVYTVTAEDRDIGTNADIIYSLSSNDETLFNIDSSTGEITTSTNINVETHPNITFIVIATDGGFPRLSGSTMVTAQVSDMNDNRPVFVVNPYDVSVDEHSPNGTLVVTVEATDDDSGANGAVVYSITLMTPSGNNFYLDPTSGDLTVNVASLPSIS